jgi:hypothetical protein
MLNPTKKILAVAIISFAIPLTVFLTIQGIKYFSRASSQPATLVFSQNPLTLNSTTSTSENVVLNVSTNKVGFARAQFTFDQTKIQLTSEITPTTTLKKIISVTSMATANSTGQITLILGLDPVDIANPPTGSFNLASLSFKAISNTSSTSNLSFVSSGIQIVDMTATPFIITATNATVNTSGPTIVPTASPIIGTPTPAPTPTGTPGLGYNGEYFDNQTLTGTPKLVRQDAAINFDWGGGSPDPLLPVDHFSVRWTKIINFVAGNYTFTAIVDDGARLKIDGTTVIDKWIDEPSTTYTYTQSLTAGNHTIVMEYYENAGGALAQMSYVQNVGATPTPTPIATATSTTSLNFHIKLQGLNTQSIDRLATIILKNGSTTISTNSNVNIVSDSTGTYAGSITNLTPGTYDVYIKEPSHLQKKFAAVTLVTGSNPEDWTASPLKAGDFNNDNKIDILDIAQILARYIALTVPVDQTNQIFDVNGDVIINIQDIALVLSNYTQLQVLGD